MNGNNNQQSNMSLFIQAKKLRQQLRDEIKNQTTNRSNRDSPDSHKDSARKRMERADS